MSNINEVVEKYIQLRDEKTAIAERHKTELAPLTESMGVIERWLLQEMDKMGIDSLKTPTGTPYKVVTKSVKLQDADAFKQFAFAPFINALSTMDGIVKGFDFYELLRGGVLWDMLDVRAGKKGIVEYVEQNGAVPPGVTFDSYTTLNIRRS